MNPPNHSVLCLWPVNIQVQQCHPACKRKCYRIPRGCDERIRSVGEMSGCREKNEKRLNAKIGREHFFLQGRKGRSGESLIGDLGHDEALRQ